MTATEELKTLERELDRWLSRAESDLANALSNTQDVTERKRIIQVSLFILSFIHPFVCTSSFYRTYFMHNFA